MRSGSIALRAAGAAAVLVLAPMAGSAYAHDGVKVTVTPSTASPGADVDVRVKGCKGTTGAAKSQAFVADAELTGRDGGDYPLFGDTTIKSGLEDGTYKVTVTCDGHDHPDVGTVQVRHRQPTHQPTQPTHHPSPVAPVRAGGGGTAAFAAPAAPGVAQTASENGLGTPYTLLGLGMAAIAAVAVAFRSSRRRATGSGTGTD
ncbi:hypothetical protein [Streptomyces sp. NBC_00094]|uniref:hypothetical protein n=1 Tax=Streptomyces sp. NBC_00094 TaxID=2903620 RepID=UPI00225C3C1E|nr:hypothetical protein [Streptomyces sp. NBC_00094]MCX5390895.1 hypothetical protein [Streptomyces sp. NBC_00094]